jgi:hypothetical protein
LKRQPKAHVTDSDFTVFFCSAISGTPFQSLPPVLTEVVRFLIFRAGQRTAERFPPPRVPGWSAWRALVTEPVAEISEMADRSACDNRICQNISVKNGVLRWSCSLRRTGAASWSKRSRWPVCARCGIALRSAPRNSITAKLACNPNNDDRATHGAAKIRHYSAPCQCVSLRLNPILWPSAAIAPYPGAAPVWLRLSTAARSADWVVDKLMPKAHARIRTRASPSGRDGHNSAGNADARRQPPRRLRRHDPVSHRL